MGSMMKYQPISAAVLYPPGATSHVIISASAVPDRLLTLYIRYVFLCACVSRREWSSNGRYCLLGDCFGSGLERGARGVLHVQS